MTDLAVSSEEMPEWLNLDLFRDLLSITDDFSLKSVEFACAKGDNFASKIYRVVLDFGAKIEKSLIVKSRPNGNGFANEFAKKFNIFPKEIEMFENVRKFEGLYAAIGCSGVVFAPRCLKVTSTPTDILIIEDLSAKGYKMTQKSAGLNEHEMKAALTKLAKFHAASAVYCETNGIHERFSRGLYNSDMKDIFTAHYEATFGFVFDNCFSKWPNFDKQIIDKMRNWKDFVLDELIRTMNPNVDGFNCLIHGDAWIANILFKTDSNNQLDCQFIDFQQSFYTSPAIDLINLIFTSAETETKLQNFEHYVKFYHGQLVDALKLLNYPKKLPAHKELYLDILDRGFLAVWQGFAILPTCLVENVQESSSDNLLAQDEAGREYKMKIYDNARYRQHMTELMTYFENRGLVELGC